MLMVLLPSDCWLVLQPTYATYVASSSTDQAVFEPITTPTPAPRVRKLLCTSFPILRLLISFSQRSNVLGLIVAGNSM